LGLAHQTIREQPRLRGKRPLATDTIDRTVARRRHQPPNRVDRNAFPWPALGRQRERLLRGVLSEIEIAEIANQRSEYTTPMLAEDCLDQGSTTGRASAALPKCANTAMELISLPPSCGLWSFV
jgi:hypothetical protein